MALNKSIPLDETLTNYLRATGGIDTPELAELRQLAAKHPSGEMQITEQQGQLLYFLMKLIRAKNVLELGVFLGYGTLSMALALPPEGKVIACDINAQAYAAARSYWQRAGVAAKVDFRPMPAKDLLKDLEKTGVNNLDAVFIDADKEGYGSYYEMCLPLLRPGGLIILDNMLWRGLVAQSPLTTEPQKSLAALNERIHSDSRVDMCLLPLADGVLLACKKPI